MKLNRVRCLPLLGVLAVLAIGCPNTVSIPDDGLEKAIRKEIGKPLGYLTEDDLAQVLELDARSSGIRNLSGIEYCTNLAWLDLDTNSISNLRPLEQLGRPENPFDSPLVYLDLDNNSITDISPLAGLLNLKQLSLFNNQVSDIEALITNVTAGGALETLILDANTTDDQTLSDDVTWLESQGVHVTLATSQ